MSCPDQRQLAAYADGSFPEALAGRLDEHLDGCPACRRLLDLLEPTSSVLLCLGRLRGAATAAGPASQNAESPATEMSFDLASTSALNGQSSLPLTGKPGHAPESVFGNYELIEKIGQGGMGAVYKARQRGVNRIVALKTTRAGQFASDEERRRFLAEAAAAGRLAHPHIVPVYEVGEHAGQPFFSMGYVEGRTLKALVADGPLPPRQAASLTRTVAEAVHFAHTKGVVHRDLKPSNVLIDSDGQPRVTDFGLAKQTAADASLTSTGQVLGTPSFMSPEQALGKPDAVGPLSDVYSLGATLYALLTGRPPFQAAASLDTLRRVVEQEPVPPRQLAATLPADLETICLKCLEKDPSRRYPSADALAADLDRFLRNEPIVARPVSRSERAWRWYQRNPLVGNLTAAALLLLVVALSVVTTAYLREKKLAGEKDSLIAEKDRLIVEKEGLITDKDQLALRETQQRQHAERLGQEAQQRADEAGRFSATLVQLLQDADPTGAVLDERQLTTSIARGQSVPLADFLARASKLARQKLAADKPALARVLGVIGRVYYNIGDYRQAESVLRSAWELQVAIAGKDDLQAADLELYLALAMADLGITPAETEDHFRHVIRLRRQAGDEKGSTVALVGLVIAQAGVRERWALLQDVAEASGGKTTALVRFLSEYLRAELARGPRPREAAKIGGKLVEDMRSELGEKHVFTLAAQIAQAGFLNQIGNLKEAEPLMRRSYQAYVDFGVAHWRFAYPLSDFALYFCERGDLTEARRLSEQAWQLTLRLPARHQENRAAHFVVLRNHGRILLRCGDSRAAAAALRESLERYSAGWDDGAKDHLTTWLCQNLILCGEFAEAQRRLLARFEARQPPWAVLNYLAVCRRELGDFAGARSLKVPPPTITRYAKPARRGIARLLDHSLEVERHEDFCDPDARNIARCAQHPDQALDLARRAFVVLLSEHEDDAHLWLHESKEVRGQALTSSDMRHCDSLLNLAVAALACGDKPTAVALSCEGLLLCQKHFAGEPFVTARIGAYAGRILSAAGQREEGRRHLRAAWDHYHQKVALVHPFAWHALEDLAAALDDPKEREKLLRDALLETRAAAPFGSWRVAELESLLGECLAAQQRFDEAEALLLHGHRVLGDCFGADHDLAAQARARLADLYQRWNKPERAQEFSHEGHQEHEGPR